VGQVGHPVLGTGVSGRSAIIPTEQRDGGGPHSVPGIVDKIDVCTAPCFEGPGIVLRNLDDVPLQSHGATVLGTLGR